MTFPLVNPAGWADAVDDITALQASTIDANLSSAIDGAAGGSCAPSAAIQIGGAGLEPTNCVNHNVRGNYSLSTAQASITYRVDRTTVNPATGTEFRIDTSSDIYISSGPALSGTANVILNVLTGPPASLVPSDGARIIFRKHVNIPGPQTDVQTMTFYNQDSDSVKIGSIAGLSFLGGPNPYVWVEFSFSAIEGKWLVVGADQRYQI
jgi:hypothetical protein